MNRERNSATNFYRLLFASLLAGLAIVPHAGQAADHTKDSLETVKKNVANGKAILIDVREDGEWKRGHLKAARLAPLSKMRTASTLEMLVKMLPKDKVIYAHCKSGGRCLIAADVLTDAGFEVRAIKAGYTDLVKAGFEKADD